MPFNRGDWGVCAACPARRRDRGDRERQSAKTHSSPVCAALVRQPSKVWSHTKPCITTCYSLHNVRQTRREENGGANASNCHMRRRSANRQPTLQDYEPPKMQDRHRAGVTPLNPNKRPITTASCCVFKPQGAMAELVQGAGFRFVRCRRRVSTHRLTAS